MTDLTELDAVALLQGYRTRAFSPVDVLACVEARIAAVEPGINAFLKLYLYEAGEQARLSEMRWAKGNPVGALDGVPISVKDHIAVSGWERRNGTPTAPAELSEDDAPAVARIREQGAVLLGKTTMTQFGWKGTSDSPLTGFTRNPWDFNRTSGGSSSGSAAAVASGIGPLALGTDGGGSVRIPCNFCGLVGLKPSGGRVPYWPMSNNHTLTHLGPIARSVRDAALLLNVLSQPDARDWYSLPYANTNYTAGLDILPEGVVISYAPAFGAIQPDPAVRAVIEQAIDALEQSGCNVQRIDLDLSEAHDIFDTLYAGGAAATGRSLTADQFEALEPALQRLIQRGRAQTGADYMRALEGRVLLGQRMKQMFSDGHILLSPTTTVPALGVGELVPPGYSEVRPHDWHYYTYPFNLTLQPAASVPVGFTLERLPVGLQVVGPMHGDALVLQVCRLIETILALPRVMPPFVSSMPTKDPKGS